jgi:hypothetical protein
MPDQDPGVGENMLSPGRGVVLTLSRVAPYTFRRFSFGAG